MTRSAGARDDGTAPQRPAAPASAWFARHRKKLVAAAAIVVAPVIAHAAIALATRIEPPPVAAFQGEVRRAGADLRVLGPAYARHRGSILEVRLVGTPEEIGHQHGRLLYDEMVADEGALYGEFRHYVPFAPLRWLITDVSRLEFRRVDRGIPDERRREIAAEAAAFSPDPFESFLPTYHRFVFLQALYDISLSFEHSPLLGCTSFALTDGAFEGGGAALARNFDFEAGPIFDLGKTVFLVHEAGRIPYASVAWPGLVGAVSAMNAEGLALVVHGGRARKPQSVGEPVVHTMRDVLGQARTIDEAVRILAARDPMVSHLVMLVDASGDVAIVERAPGAAPFVRRGRGKLPLTNHFEGPLADDPANRRVEQVTSTLARRRRLDELLANLPPGATVQDAVQILRDKRGPGGEPLALGDRRALDAVIATHAVVMDSTRRILWVSEGPHLVGRFVRFDLAKLLDPAFDPARDASPLETLPEDAIAGPTYEAWLREGAPHSTSRARPGTRPPPGADARERSKSE